ncbi:hypothetical protein EV664_107167 [Stakelama pacifica]|uniref:Uncharacterized protein n=2 Tax=Stakelama pacifica TaxID=517720 RepID=A0A4R6FMA6_9SPHN|nr:hypothetical protein EV664_107167 [Stakelama pacifica]GGO96505.1 hypothetical protein GCM10011329_23190 [Stakelama pacifica]
MNQIATIAPPATVALALPEDIDFEAWVNLGRGIVTQRRQADWLMADWFAHGTKHFADREQVQLMLVQMGVDQKRIAADAKVAERIPEGWRSDKVSFEVAKEISKIDDPAIRQRMIVQAEREHWTSRKAHHHVVEHKAATGSLLPEDDDETRQAVELIRCWNRISPEAREYAYALMEIAAGKNYAPIDEDEAA